MLTLAIHCLFFISHMPSASLSHTQLSDPLFHLDKHVGRVVRRPAAAAVPHARDDAGPPISPLSLSFWLALSLSRIDNLPVRPWVGLS